MTILNPFKNLLKRTKPLGFGVLRIAGGVESGNLGSQLPRRGWCFAPRTNPMFSTIVLSKNEPASMFGWSWKGGAPQNKASRLPLDVSRQLTNQNGIRKEGWTLMVSQNCSSMVECLASLAYAK